MTLTNRLGLDYRLDGDQNWGPAHRNVRLMLDRLLCPQNVFFVSPEFTAENLHLSGTPADRRHFDTIQGAITAFEAGGFGSGNNGGIYVYPGRYNERLVITKPMSLIAMHGCSLEAGSGGRGVHLRGTEAAPGSLITFTPAAGESNVLVIKGFNLVNVSTASGSEVGLATPMVLKTNDQGSGNYGAYKSLVHFEDCNGRLDGNNNNSWRAGFLVEAHVWVSFRRCRFSFPSNPATYVMRYPFYLTGNSNTDKWGHLSIRDCEILHWGFEDPASATIYKLGTSDTACSGLITRSSFNRTATVSPLVRDGLGLSKLVGLSTAEQAAQYGNILGYSFVEW